MLPPPLPMHPWGREGGPGRDLSWNGGGGGHKGCANVSVGTSRCQPWCALGGRLRSEERRWEGLPGHKSVCTEDGPTGLTRWRISLFHTMVTGGGGAWGRGGVAWVRGGLHGGGGGAWVRGGGAWGRGGAWVSGGGAWVGGAWVRGGGAWGRGGAWVSGGGCMGEGGGAWVRGGGAWGRGGAWVSGGGCMGEGGGAWVRGGVHGGGGVHG